MPSGLRSWRNWHSAWASERAVRIRVMRWDIFCRVIDNYGDAGVCWRLAADLNRRGVQVRLYIDAPAVLDPLIGQVSKESRTKPTNEPTVQICSWPEDSNDFEASDVADVVIEAFACDPPPRYVAAMANRSAAGAPPVWINLEYLSAEDWVGRHHKLPSPHPRYPLVKYFYFPGFTPDSGGLLREAAIATTVGKDDAAKADVASANPSRPLAIFLFCYRQPVLQGWIKGLDGAILSIAPCPAVEQIAERDVVIPEDLQLRYQPFVPQSAFDAVLRDHDLLFVRGEDSFVRAQWAGKPVFWHIYPQADAVHLHKLRAFYDRYLATDILTSTQRAVFMAFMLAWNGDTASGDCARLWPEILRMLPTLRRNALSWREKLLKQPDLVSQLQAFAADLVK